MRTLDLKKFNSKNINLKLWLKSRIDEVIFFLYLVKYYYKIIRLTK